MFLWSKFQLQAFHLLHYIYLLLSRLHWLQLCWSNLWERNLLRQDFADIIWKINEQLGLLVNPLYTFLLFMVWHLLAPVFSFTMDNLWLRFYLLHWPLSSYRDPFFITIWLLFDLWHTISISNSWLWKCWCRLKSHFYYVRLSNWIMCPCHLRSMLGGSCACYLGALKWQIDTLAWFASTVSSLSNKILT